MATNLSEELGLDGIATRCSTVHIPTLATNRCTSIFEWLTSALAAVRYLRMRSRVTTVVYLGRTDIALALGCMVFASASCPMWQLLNIAG